MGYQPFTPRGCGIIGIRSEDLLIRIDTKERSANFRASGIIGIRSEDLPFWVDSMNAALNVALVEFFDSYKILASKSPMPRNWR